MNDTMTNDKSRLLEIVNRLREAFGAPAKPVITDPFEQILFEQVAYLTTDEKRAAAFKLLRERIGLSPQDILNASDGDLLEVATAAGAAIAETRVSRMRESARIALENWDGDLSRVLELSPGKARKELQRFAMIGAPGADRILLFAEASTCLTFDSNGLRALLRLGYGADDKQYARAYRSVLEDLDAEVDGTWDTAHAAHVLFRLLGREICKSSAPRCDLCPLRDICPYPRRQNKAMKSRMEKE